VVADRSSEKRQKVAVEGCVGRVAGSTEESVVVLRQQLAGLVGSAGRIRSGKERRRLVECP